MRRNACYLTALLAIAPAAIMAQDSTSAAGSTSADARVHAALEHAVSAGIPVSLLERKVDEGKAKGVPMDRIAAAVDARLTALTRARDAMAGAGLTSTTEGELSVAADAVQGGVSATALATIASTAPAERRTVAIAVLTQLVAAGQMSDHALVQVQTALARGPEALANLGGQAGGSAQASGMAHGSAGGTGAQIDAAGGARVELGGGRAAH